jgi:hypothetical protein
VARRIGAPTQAAGNEAEKKVNRQVIEKDA